MIHKSKSLLRYIVLRTSSILKATPVIALPSSYEPNLLKQKALLAHYIISTQASQYKQTNLPPPATMKTLISIVSLRSLLVFALGLALPESGNVNTTERSVSWNHQGGGSCKSPVSIPTLSFIPFQPPPSPFSLSRYCFCSNKHPLSRFGGTEWAAGSGLGGEGRSK